MSDSNGKEPVGILALNECFLLALAQDYFRYPPDPFPPRLLSLGHDQWAVGYYRIGIPAYYLRSLGLGELVLREHIDKGSSTKEALANYHKAVEESQIVLMQRVSNYSEIRFLQSLHTRGKLAVVDTDDHMEAVDALGSTLMSEWWKEGDRAKWYAEGLDAADLITVATRRLYEIYSDRYPDKVVFLPNPVDVRSSRWNFEHQKYPETPLTIGWLAGITHILDGEVLGRSIQRIMEKFPDVRFKSIGHHPDFIRDLPQDRVILCEAVALEEFPKLLSDVDISLVPLKDHEFNRAKSDIKGCESTMAGCAVVASPRGEYLTWSEGKSILFAEDENSWVESLEMLISNPDRIREIHREALRYVLRFRAAEVVVPRWAHTYRSLLMGDRRPVAPL